MERPWQIQRTERIKKKKIVTSRHSVVLEPALAILTFSQKTLPKCHLCTTRLWMDINGQPCFPRSHSSRRHGPLNTAVTLTTEQGSVWTISVYWYIQLLFLLKIHVHIYKLMNFMKVFSDICGMGFGHLHCCLVITSHPAPFSLLIVLPPRSCCCFLSTRFHMRQGYAILIFPKSGLFAKHDVF